MRGDEATELDETVASDDRTAAPSAPHPAGTRLGRYTLAGVLGSGGMGVVYRAFDPQLGRAVALKVVRPDASSSDSHARLIREAQACAKLSHPNVIAVHDVGSVGDDVFVAMELVDGENLAAWLETKRSRAEMLDAFAQAGRGLAAAHAAGLVHRDFKPLNVLVGRDGRVRVLDFGLARTIGDIAPSADPDAATAPPALTQTGAIMGTPLYMAPEQFAGGAIDARTDQFAFCVALFHALYGAYPFRGNSMPELMVNVMSEKPIVPARARVPGWLRRIALRGLAVQADARFASMAALLAELVVGQRRGRRRVLAAAGAVSLAIGGIGIVLALRTKPDELPPFTNAELVRVTYSGKVGITALSPDGKLLAYFESERDVVVDDLVHGTARAIARIRDPVALRWSLDGTKLLVVASGGLRVIDRDGGNPRDLNGCAMATWSPDSREIMSACQPLDQPWRITALATGAVRLVKPTIPGERFVYSVDWASSNGLVLARIAGDTGNSLWVVNVADSTAHEILHASRDGLGDASWNSAGDRITYARRHGDMGELRILAFDRETMTARDIGSRSMPSSQNYSVSGDDQMLLVTAGSITSDIAVLDGEQRTNLTHDTEIHGTLAVAPDARSLAYASTAGNVTRIHVIAIDGTPIATLPPSTDTIDAIAWSPDGRELVYVAARDGANELRRVVIATGATTRVPVDDASESVAWAPGKDIIYQTVGNQNFAVLDPATNARHVLIAAQHPGWLLGAKPSPDGKQLLVWWNRSDLGGVWTVGVDGAIGSPLYVSWCWPLGWSSDGRTAFVSEGEFGSNVLAIDVASREPRIARPVPDGVVWAEPLGDRWIARIEKSTSDLWVASRDGRRIVLATSIEPYIEPPIVAQAHPVNVALTEGLIGWVASPGLRVTTADGSVTIESSIDGRLSQQIDATGFRGKRVRFQGRVRLKDTARIWIRSLVHGREVGSGLSRVPSSADWQVVDTFADIHPDAETLELALGITGSFELADATFEIVPR